MRGYITRRSKCDSNAKGFLIQETKHGDGIYTRGMPMFDEGNRTNVDSNTESCRIIDCVRPGITPSSRRPLVPYSGESLHIDEDV